MNFNFELILFYAVIISGAIVLIDRLFFAKKRQLECASVAHPDEMKLPWMVEYARSFFPILLVVFLLRSFLYEPFRIPSSSLEPTLLVGDFILVNKFDYGIRLPVLHQKIISLNEPHRGDIMVFRWPPSPNVNFIKRVIGLPGDHISYIDKVLYVNGQKIPQELEKTTTRVDEQNITQPIFLKQENLLGVKHAIYQNQNQTSEDYKDIIVPPGMYFMMGDNRDDSADSRFWGFVPEDHIVGKAVRVWLSIPTGSNEQPLLIRLKNWVKVRWDRIGKKIQ